MSDEIKVGDLVMVIRSAKCCGCADGIGTTFRVASFVFNNGTDFSCSACYVDTPGGYMAEQTADMWWGVDRLKRIDPPAVNDEVETQRELTV